jgi:hypothetical protein
VHLKIENYESRKLKQKIMKYRIVQKEYMIQGKERRVFIPQVKVYTLPSNFESTIIEGWEAIGGNNYLNDYYSYYSSFPKNIEDAEKLIDEHKQKFGIREKEDIIVKEYSF